MKSDATARFLAAAGEMEEREFQGALAARANSRAARVSHRRERETFAQSDYMTAAQVAGMLRRDPKTIRIWIRRYHLGKRHGVYKPAGRSYLLHWPTFEREFVQRQGADE